MNRPTIRIHNTETNEIIDREMTEAEFEQHLKDVTEAENRRAKFAEAEAAKAAAEAKLAALGLTADDLKALGL